MTQAVLKFTGIPHVRPVVHPSLEARRRAQALAKETCYNGMHKAFEKIIRKESL